MSAKGIKRLKKSINWLVELADEKRVWNEKYQGHYNFKVNFITLTLPAAQAHLDTTIKKECLNLFLSNLRTTCQVHNYVWRAEAQSNGNIHFHIVTDTYINHYILRQFWNRAIAKLGYIDRYSEEFQGLTLQEYIKKVDPSGGKSVERMKISYEYGQKTNWKAPNSTDIHSTRKVRDLAAYLSKYMSKGDSKKEKDGRYSLKERKIIGKKWGCSQELSKVRGVSELRETVHEKIIDWALKVKKVKVLAGEFFNVFCVRMEDWKLIFHDYYREMINGLIDRLEYKKGGICPINYRLSG